MQFWSRNVLETDRLETMERKKKSKLMELANQTFLKAAPLVSYGNVRSKVHVYEFHKWKGAR